MPQLEGSVTFTLLWRKLRIPAAGAAAAALFLVSPFDDASSQETAFSAGAPIEVGPVTLVVGGSDCEEPLRSGCTVEFVATNKGSRRALPTVGDFTLRGDASDDVGYATSTTSVRSLEPGETARFSVSFRVESGTHPAAVRFIDLSSSRAVTVYFRGS